MDHAGRRLTGGRSWWVASSTVSAAIDVGPSQKAEPESCFRIGELRRQVKLGTEATYRVLDVDRDRELVVVEVVVAPGLPPGRVLRLTSGAVAAMAIVPAQEP